MLSSSINGPNVATLMPGNHPKSAKPELDPTGAVR